MADLLEGVKVVAFTHFVIGPMGVQTLGDLGADVIGIEPVGGGWQRVWGGADNRKVDGQTILFLAVERNKGNVAINLKSAEGVKLAKRIIATSDVLITNYRPGVMEKLGLGYDDLKDEFPGLIYAACSGYGADGPYVDRPGQDLLVQALSGLMMITGCDDSGPRPVGVSAVDHHGAALLALGVTAALLRRTRTGKGGRIDVSLLASALDLQAESLVGYLNGPRTDKILPPRHIGGWLYSAPYGVYRTADGYIAISLGSPLKTLGEALSSPEVAAFPDTEGYARRDDIAATVQAAVSKHTTREWLEILPRYGIWHAPVNDYDGVRADPQVKHNGHFVTMPGATGAPVTFVTHPVRYDGQAPEVRLPPQPLGAQTAEAMRSLGLSEAEIEALEASGIIECYRPTAKP